MLHEARADSNQTDNRIHDEIVLSYKIYLFFFKETLKNVKQNYCKTRTIQCFTLSIKTKSPHCRFSLKNKLCALEVFYVIGKEVIFFQYI